MNVGFVAGSVLNKEYGISVSTLRSLANSGKITCERFGENRKRYYNEEDVRAYLRLSKIVPPISGSKGRNVVIYARVSSSNQREDLDRQVQLLSSAVKGPREIIKEIGSGLNYKRKGFVRLLDRIINKRDVSRIVILYKDRLMRFGYEMFEWICFNNGVKIEVVSDTENRELEKSEEVEMSEDILSIINYFTAKRNGLKAGKNRRLRIKIEEDSHLSEEETEIVNEQGSKLL